ncbi:BAR domain containing protein [Trichuris trichiura]|uniref:BAR domain containing protein n=1 Tax=Trichuris trichiura TaxID=36087 RepID=A0A077ZHS8_TRITR|nr:BAR domain containing protein [Trichuris trichiura]
MARFVGRLGTKLNYALGRAEKTEYDEATKTAMKNFENFKEDTDKTIDRINEYIPKASTLTKQERIAEATSKMSAHVDPSHSLSKNATAFADCMRTIGRAEQEMGVNTAENTLRVMKEFSKNEFDVYKKAKTALQNATLDMDGARAKRSRSTSPDPAVRQTLDANQRTTEQIFEERKNELMQIVNRINYHCENQYNANHAFAKAMLNFHNAAIAALQQYLNQ